MTFSNFLRGTVSAAGILVLGGVAMAADLPSRKDAAPAPVYIDAFQPFQVRLRMTAVIPDGNTTAYDSYGLILPTVGLSGGAGSQIYGANAKISTSIIPELDVSYFFTKNIAVEAICCVSYHKATGTGTLAGLDIGKTWAFPPTVLLQYHFTNFGAFQPYVGVGVNFTAFFGTNAGNNWAPFLTPAGIVGLNTVNSLKIGTSWGVAGQVGFDYMITQNWGVNVDLKRIMMEPTAYGTVYNNLAGYVPFRAKLNIDPWLVSAGVTYRFGGASAGPVVAKY